MINLETHLLTLKESLQKLTAVDLFSSESPQNLEAFFNSQKFVLVSHGTEADPILNYGNQTALDLWEMTWDEFTKTPSRLTAEAPHREERDRLFKRVAEFDFIDDYSGIRISKSGKRFRINQAIVWNVRNQNGQKIGQAAYFTNWENLP